MWLPATESPLEAREVVDVWEKDERCEERIHRWFIGILKPCFFLRFDSTHCILHCILSRLSTKNFGLISFQKQDQDPSFTFMYIHLHSFTASTYSSLELFYLLTVSILSWSWLKAYRLILCRGQFCCGLFLGQSSLFDVNFMNICEFGIDFFAGVLFLEWLKFQNLKSSESVLKIFFRSLLPTSSYWHAERFLHERLRERLRGEKPSWLQQQQSVPMGRFHSTIFYTFIRT